MDLDYETDKDNVEQEFFNVPQTSWAKTELEICIQIMAISPTYPCEDFIHYGYFHLGTSCQSHKEKSMSDHQKNEERDSYPRG